RVGRSMRLSDQRIFRAILLPAAAPGIFSGLQLGLGYMFKAVLAMEFIVNIGGLGKVVAESYDLLDMQEMYAGITAAVRVASGYEIGLGTILGVAPALLFGMLASLHPYTRRVFQPLMLYFSAVPYIIIFPVFILAFTIGPNSKVAMAAASAFFPMAINTIAAS